MSHESAPQQVSSPVRTIPVRLPSSQPSSGQPSSPPSQLQAALQSSPRRRPAQRLDDQIEGKSPLKRRRLSANKDSVVAPTGTAATPAASPPKQTVLPFSMDRLDKSVKMAMVVLKNNPMATLEDLMLLACSENFPVKDGIGFFVPDLHRLASHINVVIFFMSALKSIKPDRSDIIDSTVACDTERAYIMDVPAAIGNLIAKHFASMKVTMVSVTARNNRIEVARAAET